MYINIDEHAYERYLYIYGPSTSSAKPSGATCVAEGTS